MKNVEGIRHDGDCARAIEGATVQIELALSETHSPVEFLGETIRQLASVLRDVDLDDSSTQGAEVGAQLERLRSDLSRSIEKLQYHDRMVQHLSHVRDYLASIANQLDRDGSFSSDALDDSDEAWEALRLRLRERLISDAQRELFDLVLKAEHAPERSNAKGDDYAAQGSIELF